MRAAIWCLVFVLAGCRTHSESLDEETQSARTLLRSEQYDAALTKADDGLQRAGNKGDRRREWRFRLLKAEILLARRDLARAAAVLASAPPPEWPDLRGRYDLLKGQVAYFDRDYAQTGEYLAKAAKAARTTGSASLGAEVELRQGSLLIRQGHSREAEATFRRVIASAERMGDPYLEGSATGNLGFLLLNASRYDEAIPWFEKARALFARLGASDSVARADGNLGSCYLRLGDFKNARLLFERSQAGFAKTGNQYEQQVRIGASGEVSSETGDYAAAVEAFRRALAITRKLPSRLADPWTARWLSNLAQTDIELAHWDAAERENNEALALKQRLPGTGSKVYSVYNAARIAMARDRMTDAEQLFQQALREPAEDPTVFLDTHAGLADLYLQTNRPQKAEGEFRSTVAAIDRRSSGLLKDEYKFSYLGSLIHFYKAYVDFLMASHRPVEALEVAESSRSRVLAARTGELKSIAKRTPGDYRRLAHQAGATLLEYWLGEKHSYMWVITADRILSHPLPADGVLHPLIASYRAITLAHRDPLAVARDTGKKLYDALLAPAVDTTHSNRFIVVPDGELNSLNLETLPDGDTNRYWIESATVAVAPSLDYLAGASRTAPAAGGRLLLIGDPAPALSEFPPLPYAAQEMDSIASVMQSAQQDILRGAAARPSAYAKAQPERFAFIHFSAHALANPESPLDSAVVLSGAPDACKLFARDILPVHLNAELVTVSACRGAAARTYEGEGPVGFAWAFLSAGAHNVIAGLWDVNDRSTAELMSKLYARIAAGAPLPAALRAAKLALIQGGGSWAKPFYWAPFQLYAGGEPFPSGS